MRFEPNYIISLEKGIEYFDIGPVKIILTQNVSNYIPEEFKDKIPNSETFCYGLGIDTKKETPNFGFMLFLQCSFKSARRKSQWYVEIAVSLLRLYVIYQTKNRNFPNNGSLEYMPFLKSETKFSNAGINYDLSKKKRNASSSGFPVFYQISKEIKDELDASDFKKTCDKIFSNSDDKLISRMQRALSWMTKARANVNIAERFIFFFTALEAILSVKDNNTPIADTMARHISVIISDINHHRFENYKKIKKLYDIRSNIIHSGDTEILEIDCESLQFYTEQTCFAIIEKCLDMRFDDFSKSLKEASFGTAWLNYQHDIGTGMTPVCGT